MLRYKCAILTFLCVTWMFSISVFAQDSDSTAEPDLEAQSRLIEEITVVGQKTLFTLRMEVESAEEGVYAIFNELNSSDEFDITCTREVYIGSYFEQRDCMAAYLKDAIAQNTQDYLKGIDVQLNRNQIPAEVHQKSVAMEAEMLRLVEENPDFLEAMLKLTDLVGEYQAKKKEGFSWFK